LNILGLLEGKVIPSLDISYLDTMKATFSLTWATAKVILSITWDTTKAAFSLTWGTTKAMLSFTYGEGMGAKSRCQIA
jgi:hypothetical protein